MKIYNKYFNCNSKKLKVKAKIVFWNDKYGFATSNLGTEIYEPNINLPEFDTEKEAHDWIVNTGEWEVRDE